MDLFASMLLAVARSAGQSSWPVTDPQENVLAQITQVVGPESAGGPAAWVGGERDPARVVVRVARPDGAVLFFVDRAEARGQSPFPPPTAVVAPDGQVIGRFEDNARAFAQSYLAGQSRYLGGRSSFARAHQLFDAQQRLLGDLTWEKTQVGGNLEHAVGGRYCSCTDTSGVPVARLEDQSAWRRTRFDLRFQRQLPEPLRTLIIAVPIALTM